MKLAHDLKGALHYETYICLKGYSHRIILSMLTYRFSKTDFSVNNINRVLFCVSLSYTMSLYESRIFKAKRQFYVVKNAFASHPA